LTYVACESMGRIFLSHLGGSRIFLCASCETPLTNRAELISTRFTGATGRAFLFNRVVNLSFSEVQVFTSQQFGAMPCPTKKYTYEHCVANSYTEMEYNKIG